MKSVRKCGTSKSVMASKRRDLGFQVINGTSPIDIRHWMQTNSAYSTKVALLATRVLIEYRKISRNSQRPTTYKRCINFDSPRRRYSEVRREALRRFKFQIYMHVYCIYTILHYVQLAKVRLCDWEECPQQVQNQWRQYKKMCFLFLLVADDTYSKWIRA